MSSLTQRVLSAIGAILVLGSTIYFFNGPGLAYLSVLLVILGCNEFRRMIFPKISAPKPLQYGFMICCLLLLGLPFVGVIPHLIVIPVIFSLLVVLCLWAGKKAKSIENHFNFLAFPVLGMIYCALFPSIIIRMMLLSKGTLWVLALLVVVFCGDTFAYFSGRLFGKKHLFHEVSPKKTIAGAIGGAFGSVIFGTAFVALYLPNINLAYVLVFCLVAGLFAQSGDLIVSLFKRYGDVKDSGQIMPGHGGVLDRLDGVYAAGPLAYLFAQFSYFL